MMRRQLRHVERAGARLLRSLVVVALSCVVVAPTFAQDFLPGETTVDRLIEAGMTTPIDETLSVDGVDATLVFAYADVQRVIVRVRLSGENYAAYAGQGMDFVLSTDDGTNLLYSAALPVMPDETGGTIYDVAFIGQAARQTESGDWEIIQDYLATAGDSLDLRLTMLSMNWGAPPAADPAASPTVEPPFRFDFTLPVRPAQVVEDVGTQTVNDIAMTLEQVTVAPSETAVRLCYALPDGQDWQPVVTVSLGVVDVPASAMSLLGMPTPEDTERCVEQKYSLFYGGDVATLTVNVERLATSVPDTPEAWEGLVEELRTFGIEAEAFPQPGAYFSIDATPEGMTDAELAEIINNARENLREHVDGPWVFQVPLS